MISRLLLLYSSTLIRFKECEKVLRLGVRTGHPRFFNQVMPFLFVIRKRKFFFRGKLVKFSFLLDLFVLQISCGLDLVSMAGEWLTATANTNMSVFNGGRRIKGHLESSGILKRVQRRVY